MSGFPYSDGMYSGLDDLSDADEDLYAALTGDGGNTGAHRGGPEGGGRGGWGFDEEHDGHHQSNEAAAAAAAAAEEQEAALSPSDGYFGRRPLLPGDGPAVPGYGPGNEPRVSGPEPSSEDDPSHPYLSNCSPSHKQTDDLKVPDATSSPALPSLSSQVPHVPNVWVSDPSLEQGSAAESKAREAQEERDRNRKPFSSSSSFIPSRGSHEPSESAATTHYPDRATNITTGRHDNHYPAAVLPSAFSLLNPHPLPSTTAGPTPAASSSSRSGPTHHRYTPSASSSSAAGLTPSSNRSRRSNTIYSERSSLFSEAPPAYTPSPTSPFSSSSRPSLNYQAISSSPQPSTISTSGAVTTNMGRASVPERRGLLNGQTYQAINPQSMGGEPDENGHYDYHPRPPHGWRERMGQFSWRKHWKMVILGVVLLFITIGFLVSSVRGVKNERNIKAPGGSSGSPPAKSRPGVGNGDIPDEDKNHVKLGYPPFDGPLTWANDRMCAPKVAKTQNVELHVDFSASRNLSVSQDIKDEYGHDGKDVHIGGDVVIRRSGSGTPGAMIKVQTIANDPRLKVSIDWDDDEQQLRVLTPRSISWTDSISSPCVVIQATIWVPADSVLDSLNVEAVHLGIKLLDNLSLQLHGPARLSSTVGSIVAATDGVRDTSDLMYNAPPTTFDMDTRYVEVKTISGSISGSWPLYDYLGLETISGSIRAGVRPQDVLKERPRPAVLYAKSISGHIEVHEPIAEAAAASILEKTETGIASGPEDLIPPRSYGVDLQSMSGTLKASVAFGASFKAHTTSGKMDLTLLPVLDQSQANADIVSSDSGGDDGDSNKSKSLVETSSTSGNTAINVLEAVWTDLSTGAYVSPPLVAPPVPPRAPDAPIPPFTPSHPRNDDDTIVTPIGGGDPYDLIQPSHQQPDEQPQPQQPAQPLQPQQPAQPLQPMLPAAAAAITPPALRVLSGRHMSTSARIHATYPRSWEGFIDTDSLTGKINVGGEGVEIIRRREDGFPGIKKVVLAHRGSIEKGGNIKVHTTSGDIGVTIGSS